MVSRGSRDDWRLQGCSWGVDAQARGEMKGVPLVPSPDHRQCSFGGMYESNSEADGCFPHLPYSETLLPHLVLNVLQICRLHFPNSYWLTHLALQHARTSFCWYCSSVHQVSAVVPLTNTAVGGLSKATAQSA
jgi:hypothetical protein